MPDHRIENDADRIASVVLGAVLDNHPAHLSMEEIIRQVADDPRSFSARDDASNAITDLVAAGLFHRNGEFVFATRAAVRAEELAY
jgi:hypothetical protein